MAGLLKAISVTAMTKTVCVVGKYHSNNALLPLLTSPGAGPAGLAAAKTLIHDHPSGTFHVTVFEKSDRVGGLWPISKEDDGMVNPDMRANQSRHTVSFSDLAWPSTTRAFPRAWQVGQYLQQYVKTYPGYEIQTGSPVVKTEHRNEKWKVHVGTKMNASPEIHEFDHLIVASGFFGKPIIPSVLDGISAPVMHSSAFRDLGSLNIDRKQDQSQPPQNIVVVGGQMSGVEVAASLALKISSEANAPSSSNAASPKSVTITHVIQKPFWIMPFFFPSNPLHADRVSS